MKPLPLLFLLNCLGGVCARIAWVSANGSIAAICGMCAALVWFVDYAYVIRWWGLTPTRTDYLAMNERYHARYPDQHVPTGKFKGAQKVHAGLYVAHRSGSVFQDRKGKAS